MPKTQAFSTPSTPNSTPTTHTDARTKTSLINDKPVDSDTTDAQGTVKPHRITHSLSTDLATPRLRLLGHRGARAERLENSKAGFAHLQSLAQRQQRAHFMPQNLYGVEFDVQLTADKQLVVFHDDNLQRIYGLQSRLDQLSVAELTRLTSNEITTNVLSQNNTTSMLDDVTVRYGNSHAINDKHHTTQDKAIMCLDELWPWLTNYQHIELEIKTHDRSNPADIVSALRQYAPFNNLPITLTSFDVDLHAHMQRCPVLSQYRRGLLVAAHVSASNKRPHKDPKPQTEKLANDILADIANQSCLLAARLGCRHVGFAYLLVSEYAVALCQRYNMTLSAWTVNDVASVKRLTKMGVDYIITDYPTRMTRLEFS